MNGCPTVGRERGETSVESVLYLPVLLGLFLTAFHFVVLSHGAHLAAATASRGAALAASGMVVHGNVQMVTDEIDRVSREMGTRLVGPAGVASDERSVRVTVTIEVPRIVPFLPTKVTRTASRAHESFLLERDR